MNQNVDTNSQAIEAFESHQLLFDRVIRQLPASTELLTQIKLEYETVLKRIAESRANMASRLLQERARATEVATLSNYQKRMMELKTKLEMIKADNSRMQYEIDRMRVDRANLAAEYEEKLQFTKLKMSLSSKNNRNRRSTLGLTLSDATSINFLEKHLLSIEAKLVETREVTEKKFVPGDKKTQLQEQLKGKESARNVLYSENKSLARILRRMKVVAEAVETYFPYLEEHRLKPSNYSIERYIRVMLDSQPDEDISDEDPEDPARDLEAEMILDCHEKFNELFESERYEEAALHAATSPKGVLRTLNTLLLFKSSARHQPGKKLPLLRYCEFLLQCAPAFRPISLQESTEAARCILEQGEVDKLTHWIAQRSMPSSVPLGDLIYNNCFCSNYKLCKCGRKSLAFTVFDHCRAVTPAAICLIQQGKFVQFLSYAAKAQLTKQDFIELLCAVPSTDLAMLLISPPHPHQPVLNTFEMLKMLLEGGYSNDAINYLHAYLRKLGLTLVQAVVKDNRTESGVVEDVIALLLSTGFEDLAVDLASSWTVKNVIQRSVQQLMQEPDGSSVSDHCSSSLLSDSYQDGEMSSGMESQGGFYEVASSDD